MSHHVGSAHLKSPLKAAAAFRVRLVCSAASEATGFVASRLSSRRYLDSLWGRTLQPDARTKLRSLETLGTVQVNVK